MDIPTKLGWYWWKNNVNSEFEPVQVLASKEDPDRLVINIRNLLLPIERIGGVWGEPIARNGFLKVLTGQISRHRKTARKAKDKGELATFHIWTSIADELQIFRDNWSKPTEKVENA